MSDTFHREIYFLVAVPDWQPEQASSLAGFSLELCRSSFLLRGAAFLPANILELTPEFHESFLARRMAGISTINVFPRSPRAIMSEPVPLEAPFTVVVLGPNQKPDEYRNWAKRCPIPPTIVSATGGDLDYDGFHIEGFQRRLLAVCDLMPPEMTAKAVKEAREAISSWKALPSRLLPYKLGGHATITPNLVALGVAGYDSPVEKRFDALGDGIKPYVDQIVLTSRSVLEERAAVETGLLEANFPKTPDLALFAPAIFPDIDRLKPNAAANAEERRRFQAAKNLISKQMGYAYELRTDAQMKALSGLTSKEASEDSPRFHPHPLMQMRQLELALSTGMMELLAASEIAAVVRLPNAVNRTAGAVRQFATHYRSNAMGGARSQRAFRAVQESIAEAVPAEFIQLIRDAGDNIRIVADAHLEWLDIDGLPLCIRKNVSRIPVTPGNLFVEQMSAKRILHLTPADLKNVLIISALKPTDQIQGLFEIALNEFGKQWKDSITIAFKNVGSADELVAALNSFEGAIAIFDGHGSHEHGKPATLNLQGKACDVWSLNDRIERPPPIVILSACDTHAADRNHATTANGLLSLGTRAVLGSVFPLEARSAAAFAARLLYRVARFVPLAVGTLGRPLTWTEVCSGMLRMQLLSDLRYELFRKNLLNKEQFMNAGYAGNKAINMGSDDPFADVITTLVEYGLDRTQMERELSMAVATSSAISYVNIGRPESILLDTSERKTEVENDLSAALVAI